MEQPDPKEVYLTAFGAFLPGPPVGNDEMEAHLGMVGREPSRIRKRVLEQNGILARHYALDREGALLCSNAEMAAHALRVAIERAGLRPSDIDFLATATAQGDLALPGFASMVHGELASGPCELASLHGICATSLAALKSAVLQVRAGGKRHAAVCASEIASRFFKSSRMEETAALEPRGRLSFDSEFLRWMLSDGAGAAVVCDRPNTKGLSLRVDFVELRSFAHRYAPCMYAGAKADARGVITGSWLDYPSVGAAARDGATLLRQDLRMLDRVVEVGVENFFRLIDEGRIDPGEIDWLVCHYSSHVFKGKIASLLERGGLRIPEEKWFTNLYTKGNTGSASIFIMLEELFESGRLEPGQKIVCVVPESGRFTMGYMGLTVVGEGRARRDAPRFAPPTTIGAPPISIAKSDDLLKQRLYRGLVEVWSELMARLDRVPILERMQRGVFTLDDYQRLLIGLRQQVMEGGRWIARAASNIGIAHFALRSTFIRHAAEEHRDFLLLERDYASVGGDPAEMVRATKNVGSEALSAYLFQQASAPDPFDMLGAMFVIEGLGARLAGPWAEAIRAQLALTPDQVRFFTYHGGNDEDHLARFDAALEAFPLDAALVARVIRTAEITARLYVLQLQALDEEAPLRARAA